MKSNTRSQMNVEMREGLILPKYLLAFLNVDPLHAFSCYILLNETRARDQEEILCSKNQLKFLSQRKINNQQSTLIK